MNIWILTRSNQLKYKLGFYLQERSSNKLQETKSMGFGTLGAREQERMFHSPRMTSGMMIFDGSSSPSLIFFTRERGVERR